MGQELAKAVFTPPAPPSYDETLEGLVWVPSLLSSLPTPTTATAESTTTTTTTTAKIHPIPAVLLEWKGSHDETYVSWLWPASVGSLPCQW